MEGCTEPAGAGPPIRALTFEHAFPDASFESAMEYEARRHRDRRGLPPTVRDLRLRRCEILEVEDGVAVAHRFYCDQLDSMSQLGLMAAESGAEPYPTRGAAPTERSDPLSADALGSGSAR